MERYNEYRGKNMTVLTKDDIYRKLRYERTFAQKLRLAISKWTDDDEQLFERYAAMRDEKFRKKIIMEE